MTALRRARAATGAWLAAAPHDVDHVLMAPVVFLRFLADGRAAVRILSDARNSAPDRARTR